MITVHRTAMSYTALQNRVTVILFKLRADEVKIACFVDDDISLTHIQSTSILPHLFRTDRSHCASYYGYGYLSEACPNSIQQLPLR